MQRRSAEIRIGISGWRYAPWRGIFYPEDLSQKKELNFASRQLNTIEINGSFYSLQSPISYQAWHEQTPPDFVFAVKGPRYVTHIRRLKDVVAPLGNFFGSGVLHLKEKLGPFLWQLPPNFLYDPERLEAFFQTLPRDFASAVQLAKNADRLDPDCPKPMHATLRHALEVRHESFLNPEFIELLKAYNIAFVFADTAGQWPYMEDVTSDFIYIRLHGEAEIYRSGYDDPSLRFWARRIKKWSSGAQVKGALTITDDKPTKQMRDVYVYFDNDVKVRAPFDAQKLAQFLNL
jgi:uncharacterized protein YecE (DUF72 family)